MKRVFISFIALIVIVCISPVAESDLIDNGDGTISDSDQQIMWTKDAGMAASMTHSEVLQWVADLNISAFAGYTDWLLPNGTDPRADR